jgi:hypothetical protein
MKNVLTACMAAGILTVAYAVPVAAQTTGSANTQSSGRCDRQCLEGFVDRYLDALIAHDKSRLPLAPEVRYTENGVELPVGDALWNTASARGKYKLYVADPQAGQVGFFGTLLENGNPVLFSLRLRIDHLRRISEIETLVARPSGTSGPLSGGAKAMEERGTPRPQFLQSAPAAERTSREELIAIADSYFTHLQGSTGKTSAPFHKSCNRIENGVQTTNLTTRRPGRESFDVLMLGCEAQQLSGFYPFVTRIRDRRFPIVDEERGLVLAFGYFEHTGAVRELHLTNGQTLPSPVRAPLTFQIAELFQIHGGKIDQVEAVLTTVPYGMKSDVWDR